MSSLDRTRRHLRATREDAMLSGDYLERARGWRQIVPPAEGLKHIKQIVDRCEPLINDARDRMERSANHTAKAHEHAAAALVSANRAVGHSARPEGELVIGAAESLKEAVEAAKYESAYDRINTELLPAYHRFMSILGEVTLIAEQADNAALLGQDALGGVRTSIQEYLSIIEKP